MRCVKRIDDHPRGTSLGKLCGRLRSLVSVEFERRSISVKDHGLELGFANLKKTQAGKAYRNSGEGVNGFDSNRRLRGYSVSTEARDFTGASKEFSQTGGHAAVTIGMRCPGVLVKAFEAYFRLIDSVPRRGLIPAGSS